MLRLGHKMIRKSCQTVCSGYSVAVALPTGHKVAQVNLRCVCRLLPPGCKDNRAGRRKPLLGPQVVGAAAPFTSRTRNGRV